MNFNNNKLKPGLYCVATPIGNMGDITLRALEVLKKSDLILCEDTRVSKKLLNKFEITKKLISDPGRILINKCIEKKINIYPIPGPSAVTTAVSVSGFSDRYLFCGFLPEKKMK